jgi:hypothetical protein
MSRARLRVRLGVLVRVRVLVLVAVAAVAPAMAVAQSPAPPAAPVVGSPDPRQEPFVLGRRLKIAAPVLGQYEVIGIVDSLLGDIVVLDTMLPRDRRGLFDGGTVPVEEFRRVRVRVADVKSAWVSDGVRRGSATVRYSLIGGLIGGALFGLSGGQQYNPTLAQMRDGAIPGFLLGGGVGALVGVYNGREIWRLIPGPYYLDSPPVGRQPK